MKVHSDNIPFSPKTTEILQARQKLNLENQNNKMIMRLWDDIVDSIFISFIIVNYNI